MKAFAASTIRGLGAHVRPNGIRVGVVQFATQALLPIPFRDISNPQTAESVAWQVEGLKYTARGKLTQTNLTVVASRT